MGKKVRDVLWRDVSNKIETVVKVYDTDHLAEDLREFVIKASLARQLEALFGEFANSLSKRRKGGDGGDDIAVWIDGFFGSGKSHIAKVVGHVLENPVVDVASGTTAVELFSTHLEDPRLPGGADIKRHLKQIRDHAWCKTVAFEIRAHVDLSSNSLTAAIQSQFYESIGLSRTTWVARLEMWLQSEGIYDNFVAVYEEVNGEDEWLKDRRTPAMHEDEIAESIAHVRGWETGTAFERIQQFQTDAASLTPALLVDEMLAYLDSVGAEVQKEPQLIFVIDEMGQFIADEKDRIEELRSLVELAGAKGKGRVWFICTSQEALDKVVDRTGLQLSNLGKLDARFGTKMALTGEDVLEVVYDRVLRKKEAELEDLKKLYRDNEGQVVTLAALNIERTLANVDQATFVSAYPFLPHFVPLTQELFNAIRGYKLSGGERNMIDLAQDAAGRLAERGMGAIVPLDVAFDVFESELTATNYLGGRGMQLVREADSRVPGTPLPASRVLKALWMVQRQTWVPRTPETLGKLLAQSLDDDVAELREQTRETLDQLRRAGYVGYEDATSQYRFLSEEERGLEEDIADEIARLGIGPAKRRAETLLRERVLTKSKLNDLRVPVGGHGHVDFAIRLDSATIGGGGELTFETWSPLEGVDLDDVRRRNLAESTKGTTLWLVPDDGAALVDELKRLEALDRVASSSKWKDDQSEETIRLLKDKEKERAAAESRIAAELENRLRSGHAFYSGDESALDGKRPLESVVIEFLGVVADHAFSMHDKADKEFDERNITKYLRSPNKLAQFDPDLGLFDAQDQLIHKNPLVEEVFDELERRKDEHLDVDGASLLAHFEARPYGWPAPLTRLVLAAMLRGGAVFVQAEGAGEAIYDPTDDLAQQIFTATTKFKRARFQPIEGALGWSEINTAKKTLVDLGRSDVGDSAPELAANVRAVGDDLRNRVARVTARVESQALPMEADFSSELRQVELATEAADPVSCVRRFLEQSDDWKDARARLSALESFFAQHHDERFVLLDKLVTKARTIAEMQAPDSVAEFDAIVDAQGVAVKWPSLVNAGSAIVDVFRARYSEARTSCQEALDAVRAQVEQAGVYEDLDHDAREQVVEEFFGDGAPLHLPDVDLADEGALDRASDLHPAQALATLKVAAPTYLRQMLKRCAELAPEPDGADPAARPTVTLVVSDALIGRRLQSAADLDAVLEEIRQRVAGQLTDAEVVLE